MKKMYIFKSCLTDYSVTSLKRIAYSWLHDLFERFRHRHHGLSASYKLVVISLFTFFFANRAMADYTVAAGTSVNASTITGQSGVLTINGTLYVNQNTVSLLGFTSVIINGPDGQIYWNGNYDLKFSAGITFDINNPALGLQPTAGNGNAATRLIIGSAIIAVSSDNSNNAAYSFEEFNQAGGLSTFTIASSPASPATICYGASFTATITPVSHIVSFDCVWSINNGGSISPASVSGFTTPQTATITPTNSATAKTYTITCTLYRHGDGDPITSKTVTVTVNPLPSVAGIGGGASAVCVNGSTPAFTDATSGGSWSIINGSGSATITTGGILTGVSSGTVTVVYTKSNGTCSNTATKSVTVNALPVITGSLSVCAGAAIQLTGSGTPAGSSPWVSATITAATVNSAGLVTAVSAGTSVITYTNNNGCSTTKTVTVNPAAVGGTLPSISACSAASGVLTLAGYSGNITQWESSTDGGSTWAIISNTTSSQSYVTVPQTTLYRALVQNGTCSSVYSGIASAGIHNVWTGATDTDWFTAGNWSDLQLPDLSCPTVTILQVATNRYPILTAGTVAVNSLQINANASLTITDGIIQIAGTITNAGIFDVTDGAVELNGASNQVIPANVFYTNKIKDLIISNNVSLNGQDSLTGNLSFGSSGKTFTTNGNLILKSTASGTAAIGQIVNDNAISGDVTVERYIGTGVGSVPNHGKSWQLLAIPTQGQTIKQSWQEGATAVTGQPGGNPQPGYGTMLTSSVPGAATQSTPGFDAYTATGPSIKTYNYLANGYDNGPSSTSLPIYNQKGYFILVRGDRSVFTSNAPATPTVLRTKGTLFTPANLPPVTNVVADKMESVGNPYASAIDLRNVTKTGGVDEFFYVWDPRLGGGNNLGGFQTLYKSGNNFYAIPGGGSYGSGISNYIQSGQAFLVQATGTNGTVSFTEAAKACGSALLFTPYQAPKVQRFLRTSLYTVSPDGNTSLADGTINFFADNYSSEVDGLDAKKSNNSGENLSVKTRGKFLAIERRSLITVNDTIFLNITGEKIQNYRFEFIAQDLYKSDEELSNNLEGFVEDNYLHTRTPLNLNGTTFVDFNVVNIAGSYAADRFRIVFAPLADVKVLPVTITSLKAYPTEGNVNVEWSVENEINVKQYEVQRSMNGLQFTTLTLKGTGANNGLSAKYTSIDLQPAQGYNYYRIRSVDIDGKAQYSGVVKVFVGNSQAAISVYPNPVSNGVINLHLSNQVAGIYNIRLVNKLGQVVLLEQIKHKEGDSTEVIKFDNNLAHGIYQLVVNKPGGGVNTIDIMH